MHQFLTTQQLAEHYRISRPVMQRWLMEVGLCDANRMPTEQAMQDGICRAMSPCGTHTLFLWHWKKTVAAIREAKCRNLDEFPGDWETPDWLFDALNAEFHFTLDAAASPHNAKCKRFFTEAEDGLKQDWGQATVWCNPPWSVSVMIAWVTKAYEAAKHGATVVLLMPLWVTYGWFDCYCVAHGELRLVLSKVYFRAACGGGVGKYCVAVVFRPGARGHTIGPSIRRRNIGRYP